MRINGLWDGICQMGEPCRKRLVDLVRIEGFMVMYKDTKKERAGQQTWKDAQYH